MFRSTFVSGRLAVGMIAIGTAVAVSSVGIVRAEHAHPTTTCNSSSACATYNNTGSGPGIKGANAGAGVGVLGASNTGYGISGTSTSGVGSFGNSTNGDGVYGQTSSTNGTGVGGKALGSSSSAYGVFGGSVHGTGVGGQSTNGDGVYGISDNSGNSAYAVHGYATHSIAGFFENDGPNYTLEVMNDYAEGGYLINAVNTGNSNEFQVDYLGDGYFTGEVTALGGYNSVIRSRSGEKLAASVAMTPQATMEDTGTARLLNGEGAVRFDPSFASTIDASRGYQVLLTPNGDTRGLYVSAKYEGGFIVRENERGRSSVYFDYRVVAHPHGGSDARLPLLNIKPGPIPHRPPHVQPQRP